jgi:hypothetical protein
VYGTGVYYARVGSKGPALEKFPDIKKKKKKHLKQIHSLFITKINKGFEKDIIDFLKYNSSSH